jgi:phage terminase large subunit-like protein
LWLSEPSKRFIFFSYRADLALEHSVMRRNVLLSDWYRQRWAGRFTLAYDQNTKGYYSNNKTGKMEVITQATGSGGNCLIIDDPMSVEQAISDAERTSQNNKVRTSLLSRLDDQTKDTIILVQQRICEDDTTGSLLAGGGWEHLSISARVEDTPEKVYFPISKKTEIRPVGDLMDSVRLPELVLAQLKADLGTWQFEAQYNQKPTPKSGTVISPAWWKFYPSANKPAIRNSCDEVVVSVDTATTASDLSCDVAIQAWGFAGGRSYLLGRDTQKRNFASTLAGIKAMASTWETMTLLIEEKSTGPAVRQTLTDLGYIVIKAQPSIDKLSRLQTASPGVEAGMYYLPDDSDGVTLQSRCAQAPHCKMDDCDCFSQLANYRRTHGRAGEWLKAMADQVTAQQTGTSTDNSAYAGSPAPTLKQQYDDFRQQHGMAICKQPPVTSEVIVSTPARPRPTCPACGSTRLFVASLIKCKSCGNIFTLPRPTVS